jgi:hypothetical protein
MYICSSTTIITIITATGKDREINNIIKQIGYQDYNNYIIVIILT